MARSTKGWKWQAVAGVIALNHEDANAHARNIRRGHPGASVNTFPRGVRAGGYAFQVVAVVARHRVPVCTCGTAYERGYPDHPKCGYCVYGVNAFNPRTGEYESRGVLVEGLAKRD